ncbi:MAG TPA: carbon starvation CstA 5TM domain-containing protein, partial [Clostridia bacterium]|nr:carbon starvation CstA 5TM domain-containing protein [Clostridia bacterium]
TLAVGMAQIFSQAVSGRWLDLWYHFAIMFEALFILTTIDAGTRVGRYLLQDVLGQIWQPLGQTKNVGSNVLASVLMVGGWGYFLIQGVKDPLGGINSLWPLFGIANQMLAGIALCLATTIILKMMLNRGAETSSAPGAGAGNVAPSRPILRLAAPALITLLPLVWLLAATMTAGVDKIAHEDPRIGFLAQAKDLKSKIPALEKALEDAKASGAANTIEAAEKALRTNRTLYFNHLLDAVVAAIFLVLVSVIVLLSIREWILLLARKKLAVLHETEPVWLPDYAVVENKPLHLVGLIALGFALLKELSGEAEMERDQRLAAHCQCGHEETGAATEVTAVADTRKATQQRYLEMTEHRFKGVRRCC